MSQHPRQQVPLRPDFSAARARPADAFARSVFARVQAQVHRRPVEEFIKGDALALAIIERAAATIGTIAGSGWPAEAAAGAWREYLVSLSQFSAASRLIQLAVQGRVDTLREIFYPVRSTAVLPTPFVGEGAAIPIQSGAFSLIVLGPARKIASILGWSMEMSKRADAQAIFETMLREDVAAGLDSAFFTDAPADTVRPAGLLNGVAPLVGFSGGDEIAIRTDFATLAEAVSLDGSGTVTFIVSPERLARLRLLAPTLFPALDIVASNVIPADRIVACDGPSLLVAIDPAPEITVSNVATVHMSDTPLPIVDGATADPVRSLWQTASLSARIVHELAFTKRRAGCVAYLDGASW